MTTFNEAYNRASALLYKVIWWPEDWGLDQKDACSSYVVANSLDEAAGRFSLNRADIKSVVVMGHVIERKGQTE